MDDGVSWSVEEALRMDILEFRQKTESLLTKEHDSIPTADVSQLLQELETYLIELESQNSEMQAAQAELESQRQQFYNHYMFAPVGYVVVDANGQVEDANLAVCQLLGQERHYVIATPLSKYFDPQSRSRFFELLNTVFETAVPQQAEFVLPSHHGDKENMHVAATIQAFEEGHRRLARLALTDISEHERARKEHSNQYRIMFETSHSVKLLIDPETGDIVDANQKACQFYGYNKQALTGMKITDISQLSAREVKREMQRARAEQRQYFNFRHRLANGEVRDVEVFSGPIRIHDRTLLYSIIHDVTDLKAQESERRLLWHAVNQSANSIIITDASGNIEYVNPYFTTSTGYTLSEVVGKKPSVLKSGYTSDDEYAELWKTITSGRNWTGEFHNKRKNGDLFCERATISPVMELDGSIAHFVAIKEDITVEKQALEQLKRKEYTLRQSQSLAHVGDWTWDTRTNTVTWSDEMYRIFGIDQDTFTGDLATIIEKAIHPDDRDRVNASNDAVINEKRPGGIEYRVIWPDGTIHYVWAQPGEATTDKDGNILTLSGIVQDVTERRATIEELKHKEFMLRRSQEIARIGAWTWDLVSGTIKWDDAMYSSLGIENDSFSGNVLDVFGQIVHPDDWERVLVEMPEALQTDSSDGVEYRVLQPDGSVRHIWWLPGEPERDADGYPTLVSGIVQDITERKEAAARVQQAEQFARSTVDALSAHVAILDEQGMILAVNEAWIGFSEENGGELVNTGIGVNYLSVLRAVAPDSEGADAAKALLEGISRVTNREVDSFELEYPCHAPHERRWFVVRVTRFDTESGTRIVTAHENITEKVLAAQALERQKLALAERVKELNGLYQHSRLLEQSDLSLDTLYQATVDLIPATMQYPEITQARLTIEDRTYLTDGFHDTEWMLTRAVVVDGQELGELEVCYLEQKPSEFEGPFLEQERLLINELARRLSRKIKERHDEERLRLEAETQAVILRLLNGDTPDQDSFIELALEEAVKLTNSTIGYFHFVNRDQVSLNLFKWSRGVMDQCTTATDAHYPLEQAGIWADCVRIQQPVIHNDYANLDHKQGLPEGHFPLMRHMSVPIMDGEKPVAVLGVGNKSQDYTDLDVVRLTLMSATLWNWILRKRTVTEIQRQNSEIRAINRAISISTSTLVAEEVANMACNELSQALDAVSVMFAVLEEDSGDYRVVATSLQSPDEGRIGTLLVHAGDAILAAFERYGNPQIANGSSSDPLGQCAIPACGQNSLIMPVKLRSSLYGLFCVAFEPEHQFTDRELGFAASIVQVISQALENSLLHQAVAKHNEQLNALVDKRTVELMRTNGRLNIVLNNVTNPILLIDNEGRIDITNPAFDRKLGYEIDELFGYPVIKIFGPEKRAEITALLDTIQEQRQTPPVEAKVIAKDGTFLDVEVAFAFVEGNSGHIVCTLYDISHIKEVERIRDQFVSMVTHELRTPIASIALGVDTLQRYFVRLTDEQKLDKLLSLRRHTDTLTELVNAVLDTARFNARRSQDSAETIDLTQTLLNVVTDLKPQVESRQQTIELLSPENSLAFTGDFTDFTRIWANLLTNAIKYAGNNQVIMAGIWRCDDPTLPAIPELPFNRSEGGYFVGLVSDSGPGIRKQDLELLFSRFFRGWAAETNIPGTGLGLSLVKDILRVYGGDIGVHSQPDSGAMFYFWFPADTGSYR